MKLNKIGIALLNANMKGGDLAKELNTTKCTVSRWKNNIYQPRLEVMFKIAEILNVSVHDLIYPYRDEPKD